MTGLPLSKLRAEGIATGSWPSSNLWRQIKRQAEEKRGRGEALSLAELEALRLRWPENLLTQAPNDEGTPKGPDATVSTFAATSPQGVRHA